VESLGPEASREGSLDEKGANNIIRGTNDTLSLAVLWRSVRARHAQVHTTREEESTRDGVVKLSAIVTLDGLDSEAELSGNPSEEVNKSRKRLRLVTQRKSPRVMREIIENHKIVLKTRNAENWGCSDITVYKIKGMTRMRRRRIKRKSNMTT